jgi:hypothetical protein
MEWWSTSPGWRDVLLSESMTVRRQLDIIGAAGDSAECRWDRMVTELSLGPPRSGSWFTREVKAPNLS